jgi:hypothetical protein
MYINPFFLGVGATILAEILGLIIYAIVTTNKKK